MRLRPGHHRAPAARPAGRGDRGGALRRRARPRPEDHEDGAAPAGGRQRPAAGRLVLDRALPADRRPRARRRLGGDRQGAGPRPGAAPVPGARRGLGPGRELGHAPQAGPRQPRRCRTRRRIRADGRRRGDRAQRPDHRRSSAHRLRRRSGRSRRDARGPGTGRETRAHHAGRACAYQPHLSVGKPGPVPRSRGTGRTRGRTGPQIPAHGQRGLGLREQGREPLQPRPLGGGRRGGPACPARRPERGPARLRLRTAGLPGPGPR